MTLKVHVIPRGGQYSLRIVDGITGKTISENKTGESSNRKAHKLAAAMEADLNAGKVKAGKSVTWDVFRDAYEDAEVVEMRDSTQVTTIGQLNNFENVMAPRNLKQITFEWLERYRELRKARGIADATIQGDFRALKAALSWAKRKGFIAQLPNFPSSGNKKGRRGSRKSRKGRGKPLSETQFAKMRKAARTLENTDGESLDWLLQVLWWSGLRLEEALKLTWDEWGEGIVVDLSDEYGILIFEYGDQKNGEDDDACTMAPQFQDLLETVPEDDREGYVVNVKLSGGKVCRHRPTVGKRISAAGEKAGIRVSPVKHASAHDLRRSFGLRWAMEVPSLVLKDMMRHATVQTTEQYYVSTNAQELGAMLRAKK